jgi:GntR family transcriptional repressor for pyruvate dehydrogenase complex
LFSEKSEKAYYRVLAYLIDEIREQNIKKGDKLPTERELSVLLNVSRASVREAYKVFGVFGLVENFQGSGTYVREEVDEWLSEPMGIIFKLSGVKMEEVFEFRKMIEVETATLAAKSITELELIQLTECYENLLTVESEIEKSKQDKRFHYIIAKASKNHIIFNSYNAMSSMLDIFTYDIRATALKIEGEEVLEKIHEDIYLSIMNRDQENARKSMKAHMNMISKYFQ